MLLNKVKRIASILVILIIVDLFCMLIYWGIQELFVKPQANKKCLDGRLAYKTETHEERGNIELIEEIKEAGKEPTYTIEAAAFDFEVNKDIYEKYVKNYNTITYKVSALHIYIAESKNDFSKAEERVIERHLFPWETNRTTRFTDAEIKEAINSVKKTFDGEYWSLDFDFSSQYKPSLKSDGYVFYFDDETLCTSYCNSYDETDYENPLKNGAIKCN